MKGNNFMAKTQVNANNYDSSTFNYTHQKAIIILVAFVLAFFGLFKLFAYAENKKLDSEKAALTELMKDELLQERIEYFAKPNHSKEESFIFYCRMLGSEKSQCEYYNSLYKK